MKEQVLRTVKTLTSALVLSCLSISLAFAQQAKTSPTSTTKSTDSQTAAEPPVAVVTGSGTTGFIPVWTSHHSLGNSIATQSGTTFTVGGTVAARAFTGDGSAVTGVNALQLGGLSSSAFAQTAVANTFTGNQTFLGALSFTGSLNSALTLEGNLTDSNGEEGANVIGGFAGDANGNPANYVAPGVIGATIGGGGGTMLSTTLPAKPKLPMRQMKFPEMNSNGLTGEAADARKAMQERIQKLREERQKAEESEQGEPILNYLPVSNSINANFSTVVGGAGNSIPNFTAVGAFVGGGTFNSAGGPDAVVGGGYENNASGNGAFIGGGLQNTSSGDQSTVSGGDLNLANAMWTTVGGGGQNQALGEWDTVGGGYMNMAGALGSDTVGGGWMNMAVGGNSTVGGGTGNIAFADGATVPGGIGNQALGQSSFAAGFGARAINQNSFVWSDGQSQVLDNGPYQFVAEASGGFYFYSSGYGSGETGVMLPAGSGSWSPLSDRNAKENLAPVDGPTLLKKIATLPISTWNYKAQPASIRHMGPMAQDFHAAFGLGEDDKHIPDIDSQGLALAAVQELYRLNLEKDREIAELKEQQRRDLVELKEEKDRQVGELKEALEELKMQMVQNNILATASH